MSQSVLGTLAHTYAHTGAGVRARTRALDDLSQRQTGTDMSKGQGSMRDRMPQVAAFVDDLREHFGREEIDRAIAQGLREPGWTAHFWALENGHELGTKGDA